MRVVTIAHHDPQPDRDRDLDRDRGALVILVAIMMVALLGIGALVIDIGALLVERRELQNGADAAALAVAQDCAGPGCVNATSTATLYARLNARDDRALVETLCGQAPGIASCPAGYVPPPGTNGASGWVRAVTRTETFDGGDQVRFVLAPIMNSLTGATVRSSAVAAWGPTGSAGTLPFTFSECEFQRMIPEGAEFPVGTVTVYSKAQGRANQAPLVPDCEPRSAPGGTVEGNFGWLSVSGTDCSVDLIVGDTIQARGDPGNDNLLNKAPCSEAMVQNQTVLLPLFNQAEGVGNNVVYTISGFAAFTVTAYRLSGSAWPTGFTCPPPPGTTGAGRNLRCFQGQFIRTVTGGGEFSDGSDFGARAVKMAG
jgi:hypothetical protein